MAWPDAGRAIILDLEYEPGACVFQAGFLSVERGEIRSIWQELAERPGDEPRLLEALMRRLQCAPTAPVLTWSGRTADLPQYRTSGRVACGVTPRSNGARMRRSTERILVSHAGTVPRPAALQALHAAGDGRRAEFVAALPSAVREVVERQVRAGIDIINDGELSKGNFSHYARERLGGLEQPAAPPPHVRDRNIVGRDAREFPDFHARGGGRLRRVDSPLPTSVGNVNPTILCTAPLTYIGREAAELDIANLKAATDGLEVEAFLPAVAPGTIEHWLYNQYYSTDEELLFAIADAMHHEYKLITDAGLNLQIDDPDLPDGWQMFPEMTVSDYRKYAELRVEALNYALRDIPEEKIRLHVCWGSGHGPHKNDIPLDAIVDLILKVKAQVYSIEAANPRHDHEWRVWKSVRLPEGKSLMPGVVGHATDIIEHPRLVADRLVRYANIVGKENVIAGTDCGVGSRVFNAEIAWAKFEALAEGARIASRELRGTA